MGCCGKAKKAFNIAEGFARQRLTPPKATPNSVKFRRRTCRRCEKSSWLTWDQYWQWAKTQNLALLRNLDQLEKVEPFPIRRDYEKGTALFCTVCKCKLWEKTQVKREKCPLGKW